MTEKTITERTDSFIDACDHSQDRVHAFAMLKAHARQLAAGWAEEKQEHQATLALARQERDALSETVSKVREIHGVMKRGDATEDHGLAGNLSCILDSVCTYKEGAERRATEAHDHYQPQIDQCIRELNESSAYAGSSQRALRRIEQTLMQRLAANDAADNDWWDGAAMALCLVREERAAIGDKIETSLDLLQQATDDAHAERKCGVEGMPQPAGGHSKSGGSQNSPSSTNPVPEIVRCEHKWATDGLGPTQCVRCGEISGTTRSPAVGTPLVDAAREAIRKWEADPRLYAHTAPPPSMEQVARQLEVELAAYKTGLASQIEITNTERAAKESLITHNDHATVERAIAYCKGQAMHWPDCDADRQYDKGVAACVRILEDMLPPFPLPSQVRGSDAEAIQAFKDRFPPPPNPRAKA